MNRRRALNTVFIFSLSLNLAIVGWFGARVYRKGGIRYLAERLDFQDVKTPPAPIQVGLRERYRKLPHTEAEIDFVGDSLIGDGPWADLFSPVKNRGIGGETTSGLLERLDAIIDGHPHKVFLLTGANDLAAEVPVAQVVRNVRKILDRFRAESPKTEVYVISILPVNQTFPKGPVHDNATVHDTNRKLKDLVAEFEHVTFVDASSALSDAEGNLRKDLSVDGLHLNIEGYLVLGAVLKPYAHVAPASSQ
jgi:lysophospholipase L1-like esterase